MDDEPELMRRPPIKRKKIRRSAQEPPMTETAPELKEYQKHISDTHEERKGKAICGAKIIGWAYVDVDHAFMSIPNDRIQACPACAAKVIEVFQSSE